MWTSIPSLSEEQRTDELQRRVYDLERLLGRTQFSTRDAFENCILIYDTDSGAFRPANSFTSIKEVVVASTEHGDLGGLGDDDHPQYAQIGATEVITGGWTFSLGVGAPFTCVSGAAVVAHLDADKVDGHDLDQDVLQASSPTFVGLTLSANLVTSSTIDGVDVAGLQADVNGFPDALKNLTTVEIGQLENIGAVTISNAQWDYLGALDQGVATGDSPTFASVYINEAANANMTIGLTIDQGGADNEIVNLRSSDVGAVLAVVETNTFGVIKKDQPAAGGLALRGYKDANVNALGALVLQGFLARAPDTTKSTAGRAIVELWSNQTDGTNIVNTTADGNLFAIGTYRGGAYTTIAIFDEDGDLWLGGGMTLSLGTNQEYLFTNLAASGLAVQSQSAGANTTLGLFSADGDTTDYVQFIVYGLGTPGATTNRERLIMQWNTTGATYSIFTEAQGTGTLRPLVLYTEGNANQLYLATSGNVGILMSPTANGVLCVNLPTENLEIIDAGSVGATEQDWVEVEVGGATGYIRIYATK